VFFLAAWPWVYLGAPLFVGVWLLVWRLGRWAEWPDLLEVDVGHRVWVRTGWHPERTAWFRSHRAMTYLILALFLGYALSGVG
jgi:hypothetical protein